MSNQADSLRFTEDHEWVRQEADGTVVVGITDHAQSALGDIVFIQLPMVGAHHDAGEEIAVIESVKAASGIKAPLGSTVLEVNEVLLEETGIVNSDPMKAGWFVRLKLDDPSGFDGLLSADSYAKLV